MPQMSEQKKIQALQKQIAEIHNDRLNILIGIRNSLVNREKGFNSFIPLDVIFTWFKKTYRDLPYEAIDIYLNLFEEIIDFILERSEEPFISAYFETQKSNLDEIKARIYK